jgi:hypothetical protein
MFRRITDFILGGGNSEANTAGQNRSQYNRFFNHSPEDRVSGNLHYGAVYGVKIPLESLEHVQDLMKIYGRLQGDFQASRTASRAAQVPLLPQTPNAKVSDLVGNEAQDSSSKEPVSTYFERSRYDFGVRLNTHYLLRKNKNCAQSARTMGPTIGPSTKNEPTTAQLSGEKEPVIAFKNGYLYSNISELDLKLVLSDLMSQATGFKGVLENHRLSEKMFVHLMNPNNHNYAFDPKGLEVLRGAFMLDRDGGVLEPLEPEPSPSPQLPSVQDQTSLYKLTSEQTR